MMEQKVCRTGESRDSAIYLDLWISISIHEALSTGRLNTAIRLEFEEVHNEVYVSMKHYSLLLGCCTLRIGSGRLLLAFR